MNAHDLWHVYLDGLACGLFVGGLMRWAESSYVMYVVGGWIVYAISLVVRP